MLVQSFMSVVEMEGVKRKEQGYLIIINKCRPLFPLKEISGLRRLLGREHNFNTIEDAKTHDLSYFMA